MKLKLKGIEVRNPFKTLSAFIIFLIGRFATIGHLFLKGFGEEIEG